MNKKVYFDEIGNAVLRDGNIEKMVFNKNQVDVLKMIIEEVLSNKYSPKGSKNMRTISKNKYSAELTNILREFSKSKYEIYTDSGDYTELDAIRAGINSLDYSGWDNLAEDDFLGDVHALWIGEAVIEPEDERNYYKMAKAKSTEGNDLYLGLRNDELFLTPKFDFAHKFTEDDLHTALIKAKLCSTSITKVKTGNETDGQDSNPSDILTKSDSITKTR